MSEFSPEKISAAIKDCAHGGDETVLQCCVGMSLCCCYEKVCCEFSPKNSSTKTRKVNEKKLKIGTEFGFFYNRKPRYIDLASVKWGAGNNKDKVNKINWLCEVKVIKPDRYSYNGRWYPYIYKLMINGSKPFDFLEKIGINNIATDADEGQIIFDFIKMMACRQTTTSSSSNAPIYQIIAIKKEGNINGFDACKNAVVDVLNSWKSHLRLTTDSTAQIYAWKDFVTQERCQKFALQCVLEDVAGCVITDRGSSNEYQHILIDWQPATGTNMDFTFQSNP